MELVRVERFELITRLILSQAPLPIGLHAQAKVVLSEGFEPSSTRPSTVRVYQLRHDSML